LILIHILDKGITVVRLCPLKTLYAALLLLVISTISASAYALNQTYQVYTQGGDYYLKTDPNWVPISGEIFIIIPVYQEGEILKLSLVNGNWQVQNVSLGEFNSASPSILNNGLLGYTDYNGDGIQDLTVALGGNLSVRLISGNSQSSVFVATGSPVTTRRVIFIHTDLLGSPAAETDEQGNVL
jgi:hypothetical protein